MSHYVFIKYIFYFCGGRALMIEYSTTYIAGLFLLSNSLFYDERGCFKKVFSKDIFAELSLNTDFAELYYSINKRNVIRGMHFQTPPMDHVKMVYVISGKIHDVCLDLRRNSKTFGKCFDCMLSGDDRKYLYIPRGIAHGFACLEDNTVVHYAQTTGYSSIHDSGIHYDSFGFDWGIQNPILSDRDKSFPSLANFNTEF
jgi:dTDP-4-dehydrorhamnose 3,5-epimerase/CDP-3, 6-dideoxy-D-glycero-D-glycero-4-hexulose-5-epimerase